MSIEYINKQINAEKDRHLQQINRLENAKCSENEQHQRKMKTLNLRLERAKNLQKTVENENKNGYNNKEKLIENLNYIIKQAIM